MVSINSVGEIKTSAESWTESELELSNSEIADVFDPQVFSGPKADTSEYYAFNTALLPDPLKHTKLISLRSFINQSVLVTDATNRTGLQQNRIHRKVSKIALMESDKEPPALFPAFSLKIQDSHEQLVTKLKAMNNPNDKSSELFEGLKGYERAKAISDCQKINQQIGQIFKVLSALSVPVTSDSDEGDGRCGLSAAILLDQHQTRAPAFLISPEKFERCLKEFFGITEIGMIYIRNFISKAQVRVSKKSANFGTHFAYDRLLILLWEVFENGQLFEEGEEYQMTAVLPAAHYYLQTLCKFQRLLGSGHIPNTRVVLALADSDIGNETLGLTQAISALEIKMVSLKFENVEKKTKICVQIESEDKTKSDIEVLTQFSLEGELSQGVTVDLSKESLQALTIVKCLETSKLILVEFRFGERVIKLGKADPKVKAEVFELNFESEPKLIAPIVKGEELVGFAGVINYFPKDLPRLGLKKIPTNFDLDSFYDLPLRIDVSCYSKEQLELYSTTINVLKFNLNNFSKDCNKMLDFLEQTFPNCSVLVNQVEPETIGTFTVRVLGVNEQKGGLEDHIICSSTQIPSVESILDQFAIMFLEHGNAELMLQKQKTFLGRRKFNSEGNCRLGEDQVENDLYLSRSRRQADSGKLKCTGIGCGFEFDAQRNSKCRSHFGKWDFGHTGVTISSAARDGSKGVWWEPHWTCCGRGWKDPCTNFHLHTGVPIEKFVEIPVNQENPETQQYYRKRVRESWLKYLERFRIPDEAALKERISKYCTKYFQKMDAIPADKLPELCDYLNLHLLVIDKEMGFHFKFVDVVNKKASEYLVEDNKISIEKFSRWWFASIAELAQFRQ